MDINAVAEAVATDEQIIDIVIYQRNGEPYKAPDGTDCTIGILGAESKAVRQGRTQISRRNLRSRKMHLEPEDLLRNRIDEAVCAVKRWHGWQNGGADAPCEPENVAELLKWNHILLQVEAGIEGHAGFLRKGSKS